MKHYGKVLKQYFDPYIQRKIDTTVWDETEKRALSETDVELREASKTPASMPWFSLESGVQLSKMNLEEDDSSEEDWGAQQYTNIRLSSHNQKNKNTHKRQVPFK